MVRYYLRLVFREAPRRAYPIVRRGRAIVRIAAGIGWAVLAMLGIGATQLPQRLSNFVGWGIVAAMLLAYLFALFRENYEQMPAAAERAKPRLRLSFNPRHPSSCQSTIQEVWHNVPPTDVRLYRVRVENLGDKTIDDVEVRLVSFVPQGAPFLPAPLDRMNDATKSPSFTLRPRDSAFVEVARGPRRQGQRPGTQSAIELLYAPSRVLKIPVKRYMLTLEAVGRDCPAERRRYAVDIDGEGMLTFEELDGAETEQDDMAPAPPIVLRRRSSSPVGTLVGRFRAPS